MDEFRKIHRGWVTEALEKQSYREPQPRWTDSIAVGSEAFVGDTKEKLGTKAMWREIVGANGTYGLREPETCYEADFGLKKVGLRQENAFFWDISV